MTAQANKSSISSRITAINEMIDPSLNLTLKCIDDAYNGWFARVSPNASSELRAINSLKEDISKFTEEFRGKACTAIIDLAPDGFEYVRQCASYFVRALSDGSARIADERDSTGIINQVTMLRNELNSWTLASPCTPMLRHDETYIRDPDAEWV